MTIFIHTTVSCTAAVWFGSWSIHTCLGFITWSLTTSLYSRVSLPFIQSHWYSSPQGCALAAIEACVPDARAWLIHNRLLINYAKFEFMIAGSCQQLWKISIDSSTIGDSTIQPLDKVLNLGLTLTCPSPSTLARPASKLSMVCTYFGKLRTFSVLSPRKFSFMHLPVMGR